MSRKRVVISNIQPQVESGSYPAKAIVNENIIISADIFTDGHDWIDASVFVKYEKDKQWKEIPMQLIGNDHWEAILNLTKPGYYQFQMQAWIDHFATWAKGLEKKFEAGQNIDIELQIGTELIEKAANTAKANDKKELLLLAKELKSPLDIDNAVSIAVSADTTAIMRRAMDKSLATKHPQTYKIEAERRKAGFSTWYEVFPRSASPEPGRHGTFKDLERLLPRIAGMGFDVLYLPPIHPIGEINRKGKNNSLVAAKEEPGSPWAIGNRLGGHKSVHPELGTLDDFEDLIKAAQKFDIEIAMDIAYQCAPDHPYVKEHPEWFRWRPDGTVQYAENPPKKYEDILPLNFETEDWENLWQELKSIIDHWIDKGVNIFRIDNPHTKALAFWEWMIGEVRKRNPQVIFLAEAFTRPRIMERLAKAGFNQSYTYFTWRNTKKELEEYLTELTRTDMRYYFRPNFWPNTPDILPPELTAGGANAHIIRLILAATMSSNYGLYGPVYEYALTTPMPGKEEYIDNEKYEIKHWDWDKYTRIGEIISRLNRIRRQNAALQTTYNIAFAETTNDQIICYTKVDTETKNSLIIVVNLDPFHSQSAHVKISAKKLDLVPGSSYIVNDLLSGDKYHWQDEWNYVQLDPDAMPAHLFNVQTQQTLADD